MQGSKQRRYARNEAARDEYDMNAEYLPGTRLQYDGKHLVITIGSIRTPDGQVINGVRIFEKECVDCRETFHANAAWPVRCTSCHVEWVERRDEAKRNQRKGVFVMKDEDLKALASQIETKNDKLQRILDIINE